MVAGPTMVEVPSALALSINLRRTIASKEAGAHRRRDRSVHRGAAARASTHLGLPSGQGCGGDAGVPGRATNDLRVRARRIGPIAQTVHGVGGVLRTEDR